VCVENGDRSRAIGVALPVETQGQLPYHRVQVSDNREPAALFCGRIVLFRESILTAMQTKRVKP
jgi:hypothetical protein